MSETLISIRGITKHFPGVNALRDVSFDIARNTVHCIVGENGLQTGSFREFQSIARSPEQVFQHPEKKYANLHRNHEVPQRQSAIRISTAY